MILHAWFGGGNSFLWGFPFIDTPNAFLLIMDTLFTIYCVKEKFAHGVTEPEAVSIVDQSINSWSLSCRPQLPMLSPAAYFFFCWLSLSTFFTIFCSSIKNARTTLSFTQFAHLEPP